MWFLAAFHIQQYVQSGIELSSEFITSRCIRWLYHWKTATLHLQQNQRDVGILMIHGWILFLHIFLKVTSSAHHLVTLNTLLGTICISGALRICHWQCECLSTHGQKMLARGNDCYGQDDRQSRWSNGLFLGFIYQYITQVEINRFYLHVQNFSLVFSKYAFAKWWRDCQQNLHLNK
jgi:hypothetical protein